MQTERGRRPSSASSTNARAASQRGPSWRAARALKGQQAARALLGCAALWLGSACGSTPPPNSPEKTEQEATPAQESPLHIAPTWAYLPPRAQGVSPRWLLLLSPQRLRADEHLQALLEPPGTSGLLDALSGLPLPLSGASRLALARYAEGALLLAESSEASEHWATLVSALPPNSGDQTKASSARPHPELWVEQRAYPTQLLSASRLGSQLLTLSAEPRAALSSTAALSSSAAPLSRAFQEHALRISLENQPVAHGLLSAPPLNALPEALQGAPIAFYALGPFQAQLLPGWEHLLPLADALALGAQPSPSQPDRQRISIYLLGRWEEIGARSTAYLIDAWEALCQSTLGASWGLNQLRAAPVVSGTKELLKLELELDLPQFLSGVAASQRRELQDNISGLFNLGRTNRGQARPKAQAP